MSTAASLAGTRPAPDTSSSAPSDKGFGGKLQSAAAGLEKSGGPTGPRTEFRLNPGAALSGNGPALRREVTGSQSGVSTRVRTVDNQGPNEDLQAARVSTRNGSVTVTPTTIGANANLVQGRDANLSAGVTVNPNAAQNGTTVRATATLGPVYGRIETNDLDAGASRTTTRVGAYIPTKKGGTDAEGTPQGLVVGVQNRSSENARGRRSDVQDVVVELNGGRLGPGATLDVAVSAGDSGVSASAGSRINLSPNASIRPEVAAGFNSNGEGNVAASVSVNVQF